MRCNCLSFAFGVLLVASSSIGNAEPLSPSRLRKLSPRQLEDHPDATTLDAFPEVNVLAGVKVNPNCDPSNLALGALYDARSWCVIGPGVSVITPEIRANSSLVEWTSGGSVSQKGTLNQQKREKLKAMNIDASADKIDVFGAVSLSGYFKSWEESSSKSNCASLFVSYQEDIGREQISISGIRADSGPGFVEFVGDLLSKDEEEPDSLKGKVTHAITAVTYGARLSAEISFCWRNSRGKDQIDAKLTGKFGMGIVEGPEITIHFEELDESFMEDVDISVDIEVVGGEPPDLSGFTSNPLRLFEELMNFKDSVITENGRRKGAPVRYHMAKIHFLYPQLDTRLLTMYKMMEEAALDALLLKMDDLLAFQQEVPEPLREFRDSVLPLLQGTHPMKALNKRVENYTDDLREWATDQMRDLRRLIRAQKRGQSSNDEIIDLVDRITTDERFGGGKIERQMSEFDEMKNFIQRELLGIRWFERLDLIPSGQQDIQNTRIESLTTAGSIQNDLLVIVRVNHNTTRTHPRAQRRLLREFATAVKLLSRQTDIDLIFVLCDDTGEPDATEEPSLDIRFLDPIFDGQTSDQKRVTGEGAIQYLRLLALFSSGPAGVEELSNTPKDKLRLEILMAFLTRENFHFPSGDFSTALVDAEEALEPAQLATKVVAATGLGDVTGSSCVFSVTAAVAKDKSGALVAYLQDELDREMSEEHPSDCIRVIGSNSDLTGLPANLVSFNMTEGCEEEFVPPENLVQRAATPDLCFTKDTPHATALLSFHDFPVAILEDTDGVSELANAAKVAERPFVPDHFVALNISQLPRANVAGTPNAYDVSRVVQGLPFRHPLVRLLVRLSSSAWDASSRQRFMKDHAVLWMGAALLNLYSNAYGNESAASSFFFFDSGRKEYRKIERGTWCRVDSREGRGGKEIDIRQAKTLEEAMIIRQGEVKLCPSMIDIGQCVDTPYRVFGDGTSLQGQGSWKVRFCNGMDVKWLNSGFYIWDQNGVEILHVDGRDYSNIFFGHHAGSGCFWLCRPGLVGCKGWPTPPGFRCGQFPGAYVEVGNDGEWAVYAADGQKLYTVASPGA